MASLANESVAITVPAFVPVRQRAIAGKDIHPFLECAPSLCQRPREALWQSFLGPTVAGHTMHLLDYFFLLWFIGSIVVVSGYGARVPAFVYGALITLLSAATVSLWILSVSRM